MRCISIMIAMMLFTLSLKAPSDSRAIIVKDKPIEPYETIWNAVCAVESNNNPFAIGDTHLKQYSFGIAQIRKIKVDWYNNKTGNQYTIKDCFDTSVSKKIFMFHMMQYNDVNYAIRKWNGSGVKTFTYLKKVRKHL